MSDQTEYREAFNKGASSTLPIILSKTPAGFPVMVIPNDSQVQSLEKYLNNPIRKDSCPKFYHPESFIEYVKTFKMPETKIFCRADVGFFGAIFDYHTITKRSWCSKKAELVIEKTPEWIKWLSHNGQSFPQEAFAEFLEDMAGDIADPPAAEVLEACLNLHAKKEGVFKSGLKLQDGSIEFQFDEKLESKGTGQIKMPDHFTLGIMPFHGSEPFQVMVHLRFRIRDGKLSFFYKMVQPEKTEEAAFKKFYDQVEKGTGIAPLYGKV